MFIFTKKMPLAVRHIHAFALVTIDTELQDWTKKTGSNRFGNDLDHPAGCLTKHDLRPRN